MIDAKYLLSPLAIREQTERLWQLTLSGEGCFALELDNVDFIADRVIQTIERNYPDLNIPYHSRWGHFKAGRPDRLDTFFEQLPKDHIERIKICTELAITSVLLDAGAGADWGYTEVTAEGELKLRRSEGLAIASYDVFRQGMFSGSAKLEADAEGLEKFSIDDLKRGFQINDSNPLMAPEGRVGLINSLSQVAEKMSDGRLGGIVEFIIDDSTHGGESANYISAVSIFNAIVEHLGPIWPGRIVYEGKNLGDVWRHSKLGDEPECFVPFHKLSQWLTYSLFEPFEWNGYQISNIDKLTGLAEYRNGGLFVDGGVLKLKDPSMQNRSHLPQSDLIIEWRALTIQLLDRVAELVQQKLGKTKEEFPLARVLEGGTWATGRELGRERRANGEPPLQIISDGTVF